MTTAAQTDVSARAFARDLLRVGAAFVMPSARARVGATQTQTQTSDGARVAGSVLYLGAAGAQGLFSYALFTGKWIFATAHPVWGVLFALGAIGGLYGAANQMTASDPFEDARSALAMKRLADEAMAAQAARDAANKE